MSFIKRELSENTEITSLSAKSEITIPTETFIYVGFCPGIGALRQYPVIVNDSPAGKRHDGDGLREKAGRGWPAETYGIGRI